MKRDKLLLVILLFLSTIWTVRVSRSAVSRHHSYESNLWDLGWQEQVVWNTSQGRILQSSMRNEKKGLFLGDHITFSPIYLAPLYRLLPKTETLLVAQTAILASGSWLIFILAKRKLESDLAAFMVGLSYLFSPLPVNIATFDFHEIVLVVPILFILFLTLIKGQERAAMAFSFLALTIKEEVALTIAAIGLMAILWQKKRLGLIIVGVSIIWFVISLGLSTRLFPPGPLVRRSHRYPASLSRQIEFLPSKLHFLTGTLGMFGFLPLLSGLAVLPSAPALLYHSLSIFGPQLSWSYHYSAIWLAPLFLASIFAIEKIAFLAKKRLGLNRVISELTVAGWLAIVVILSGAAFGEVKTGLLFPGRVVLNHRAWWRDQAIRMIPAQADVAAGNSLGAHLAKRQGLYDFPRAPFQAEWVVFDTWRQVDQGFEGEGFYLDQLDKLNTSLEYQLIANFGGVLVYQRVV